MQGNYHQLDFIANNLTGSVKMCDEHVVVRQDRCAPSKPVLMAETANLFNRLSNAYARRQSYPSVQTCAEQLRAALAETFN